MDKLERILDEVEVGLDKLVEDECWLINSHSLSLFILSFLLFAIGCGSALHDLYYTLKFKVYWRIKFRKLL